MRDRLKAFLDAVCADPALEQRFLHTLSLLEFMGARKIGRSVAAHHPPAAVLDHWADETRHAAAFARLAAHGPRPMAHVTYFEEEATKTYFQGIDGQLAKALATPGEPSAAAEGVLNYLLVTTVIERRAMMVYPLYRAATHRDDVREALAGIIVEEQRHRIAIEAAAAAALQEQQRPPLEHFLPVEEQLFTAWLSVLEAEVTRPPDARRAAAAATTQTL